MITVFLRFRLSLTWITCVCGHVFSTSELDINDQEIMGFLFGAMSKV